MEDDVSTMLQRQKCFVILDQELTLPSFPGLAFLPASVVPQVSLVPPRPPVPANQRTNQHESMNEQMGTHPNDAS